MASNIFIPKGGGLVKPKITPKIKTPSGGEFTIGTGKPNLPTSGPGIKKSATPKFSPLLPIGIAQRIAKGFIINQVNKLKEDGELGERNIELPEVYEYADQWETKQSYLGTPMVDPFLFASGRYFDIDDFEQKEEDAIQYDGMYMPATVITIRQEKNIIKTPIAGRDGTVKEYISRGDYVVSGQGYISTQLNHTLLDGDGNEVNPTSGSGPRLSVRDQLQRLKAISDAKATINVFSNMLSFFDIKSVVLTKFEVRQMEGFEDMMEISFEALSDVDIGFEEIEPPTTS